MKNIDFKLSLLLRHAFLTGAGYGDNEKVDSVDQVRWIEYEPPNAIFDQFMSAIREQEFREAKGKEE